MPDRISSVLLDLDGTLIQSHQGILSSCRAAMASLGYALRSDLEVSSVIGPPIEDVMRYLLEPFSDDRIAEAVDAYRENYLSSGLLMSETYSGIPEQLKDLCDQGYRLFLATSKRTTFAVKILDNLKLSALFTAIHGSIPGAGPDHKSELIGQLLKEEHLRADQCVMVGDRVFDIVGAHANGMKAIGVLWGYGSIEELKAARADVILQRTSELSGCIKTISV